MWCAREKRFHRRWTKNSLVANTFVSNFYFHNAQESDNTSQDVEAINYPCILFMDSLALHDKNRICNSISWYELCFRVQVYQELTVVFLLKLSDAGVVKEEEHPARLLEQAKLPPD